MISAKLPATAWASLTKCMSTDAQQQQRWQLSQPSNAAPATYTAGAGFGIWLPQSCLVGAHALLHSARTYSGSVPLLQSASSGRQVYTPACMGAATQGRQANRRAAAAALRRSGWEVGAELMTTIVRQHLGAAPDVAATRWLTLHRRSRRSLCTLPFTPILQAAGSVPS